MPDDFIPAERRRQMADVFGVEPDHAGFQFVRDAQRAAHVAGPDVTGEALLHAIGDFDASFSSLKGITVRNGRTFSCAMRILEVPPVTSVGCT